MPIPSRSPRRRAPRRDDQGEVDLHHPPDPPGQFGVYQAIDSTTTEYHDVDFGTSADDNVALTEIGGCYSPIGYITRATTSPTPRNAAPDPQEDTMRLPPRMLFAACTACSEDAHSPDADIIVSGGGSDVINGGGPDPGDDDLRTPARSVAPPTWIGDDVIQGSVGGSDVINCGGMDVIACGGGSMDVIPSSECESDDSVGDVQEPDPDVIHGSGPCGDVIQGG